MSTLRLTGVGREAGGRALLREVSLTFRDGGINLLLGPNGAGKTTLLRVCALLDPPDTGTLRWTRGRGGGGGKKLPAQKGRGKDTAGASAPGQGQVVTMVFQRPVLFNRTVRANLAYPLEVRGLRREVRAERIEEAMAVADLETLAHRAARTLSGGEAQRLALARAFVTRPELLLLDEPAANMDPASRWRIEEMVLEMQDRFGTTVVLTTHDLLQARKIGEAVFFIHQGKVTGPYRNTDFFHDPPTPEAAHFIAGVLHTGG